MTSPGPGDEVGTFPASTDADGVSDAGGVSGVDDVRAALGRVMAEIDAEVQRRRAAGDLPPSMERELDELFLRYAPETGGRDAPASSAVRAVEAVAFIDPVVPVGSERSGGAVVKRTMRSLSLWYMGFVTAQVNQFAAAVARCLHVFEQELEDLRHRLAALEPARDGAVVEVPWAHRADAWWVAEVDAALRGIRGRVAHTAAGDGWLVGPLASGGLDAYGVDPRPVPVDRGVGHGLDLRVEDPLEHLAVVAPAGLAALVISGVSEGLSDGARRRLVALAGSTLEPGGTLCVHSLSPSAWDGPDAPPGADLLPGRPIRSGSWAALLCECGFSVRVVDGPPRGALASVPGLDDAVSAAVEARLLGPGDYLVVATSPSGDPGHRSLPTT